MTVVAVEEDTRPQIVHNLEIADAHTYFAGELEAWGHNKWGGNPQANRRQGKKWEAEIEKSLCGLNYKKQVYFSTPIGGRFLDFVIYDAVGNPIWGIEAKSGNARRSCSQRAKDAWIEGDKKFPIDEVRNKR